MAEFAGDKKSGKSLLADIERKFIDLTVPKIPNFIMSHHLTMFTLL